MDNIRSDDEPALLNEIRILKRELASLGEESYEIAMKRKLIRHRIADLEWNLRNPDKKV